MTIQQATRTDEFSYKPSSLHISHRLRDKRQSPSIFIIVLHTVSSGAVDWKFLMPVDPFSSHLPRWHPKRVFFKLATAAGEMVARQLYEQTAMPQRLLTSLPRAPSNTERPAGGVTTLQLRYLLAALEFSESLGGVVVEVGAYKGETTRVLAGATRRTVVAVDRYFTGWSLAGPALAKFRENTEKLANVVLERKSSGEAARGWRHGPASMVFIDAQHNFVNTSFDIRVWRPLLLPGGLLALHDTDASAGTRLAAWRASKYLPLWAHIENLTILQNADSECETRCA